MKLSQPAIPVDRLKLTREERKAASSLRLSNQPDDVLRLLAQAGDDAALAEFARRHPDGRYLRLNADPGDAP